MNKQLITITAISSLALCTLALAQSLKSLSITLAGKSMQVESIIVKGKTFVSLEQLRLALPNPGLPNAAPAAGGANQVAAASGCIGELLFNGAWRFRVQNVAWDASEKVWSVRVELRNGTNKVMSATGNGAGGVGEDISLVMQSGNSLNIYYASRLQRELLFKNLAAGAGAVANVQFKADDDTDKPVKFLWAMSAKENNGKAPLSKQPGLRVDLTCQK